MSKKFFFLFLFIIISITKSNYIHLNFVKDKYQSPYDIENVFFTSISTSLSIGTPSKKIFLQISTDTAFFALKGDSLKEKNYEQEKSSSFYFTKYGHSYSIRNIYFHSIFFDENYIINKNNIKLNAMMCWGKTPITKSDGVLGLKLKDIMFNEQNIFLNQLYENKIINNKIFSLIFTTENKGELIIGDYPMNKTNLLKNKKLKICKNNFPTQGEVWGTIFSEINFYEKTPKINYEINFVEKTHLVIFSTTYYGYLGSADYNYFIYETFFKEKINSKNCWTQTIDDDKYFGYVCSKNTDMNAIPNIKFYHKELNYTFEIDNKEMWIARNNIKYFLIFFCYKNQYSWTFGEKFLKKYNIVFDGSNNLIGVYYSENNNMINNMIDNIKLLIGIFIVGLIVLCLVIGCIYINRNKKKEKDKDKEKEEEIELNLIENNKL